MTVKFRVEGLKDINKALGELPRATGKAALVRFAKKRLEPMRDAAKANAPVQEGDLRESIIIGTRQGSPSQRKKRFANKAAVEVAMGPSGDGYPQAVPQEFGSINNPPSGYMRRAWDAKAPALVPGFAADLWSVVAASARRHAKKLARRGG